MSVTEGAKIEEKRIFPFRYAVARQAEEMANEETSKASWVATPATFWAEECLLSGSQFGDH